LVICCIADWQSARPRNTDRPAKIEFRLRQPLCHRSQIANLRYSRPSLRYNQDTPHCFAIPPLIQLFHACRAFSSLVILSSFDIRASSFARYKSGQERRSDRAGTATGGLEWWFKEG
jgi:hypothetical protein